MFGEVEVALYVSITESLQFIIVVIFIQETTHYLLAFGFRVLGLGVILALLRLWRWRTGREGHWRRNERHSCDWRRRGQEDHRPTGGGDVIELELLAGLCRRICFSVRTFAAPSSASPILVPGLISSSLRKTSDKFHARCWMTTLLRRFSAR